MIKKRVVLVLGAGASAPFKFPLGQGLKDEIVFKLNDKKNPYFKALNAIGFDRYIVEEFVNNLSFSGRNSVDEFLEFRNKFIDVGKAAIDLVLSKHENRQELFSKGDWYQYIYNMMNTSFDDFENNQISFITFNYDRSLEYYLNTALQNSYGVSQDESYAKLKNIPIVHLHGQLGGYPSETSDIREFGLPIIENQNFLEKVGKGIKIIHEHSEITKDKEFATARTLIPKSTILLFLGFGYNEVNVKRLFEGLNKYPTRVYGTGFKLEPGEVSKVKNIFASLNIQIEIADKDTDILMYLRGHRDWIEG